MNILWTAIVLLLTPQGDLTLVHNPHSFKSQSQCEAYLTKSLASVPSEALVSSLCLKVVPGTNI